MHIYLQWDPWVIRTKKKDSQEYKTLWCGNNWSSLGFLSKTLNIKALVSTRCLKTLKNPRHTSQRAPKLFLFLEDTPVQWCFLRIILQVETIQHVKQQWDSLTGSAQLGTSPWNHQQARLSCIFLCPCCTGFIRCTHFCQPFPLLHQE